MVSIYDHILKLKGDRDVDALTIEDSTKYPIFYNPLNISSLNPPDPVGYLKQLKMVQKIMEANHLDADKVDQYDKHLKQSILDAVLVSGIPTTKWVYDILEDLEYIVLVEKYRHNKPRPYQLASALGIELNHINKDRRRGPSYPSGHALEATVIGMIVKHLNGSDKALQIADDISLSRIQAGVHFPCDVIEGKRLAKRLSSEIISNYF